MFDLRRLQFVSQLSELRECGYGIFDEVCAYLKEC